MIKSEKQIKQAENRNLLSSFFITLLIGLAFQEMILTTRDSILNEGFTLNNILFVLIFFFISIRFFVGNQLHLSSESLVCLPGLVWLYDLMAIICQSILLVFVGSFSSNAVSSTSSIGFLDFIVSLYVIDVIWIISQWVLGKIFKDWVREFVPFAWAILNTCLVISFHVLNVAIGDVYTTQGLIWLTALNLLGFVIDVILVDYYDAV